MTEVRKIIAARMSKRTWTEPDRTLLQKLRRIGLCAELRVNSHAPFSERCRLVVVRATVFLIALGHRGAAAALLPEMEDRDGTVEQ